MKDEHENNEELRIK